MPLHERKESRRLLPNPLHDDDDDTEAEEDDHGTIGHIRKIAPSYTIDAREYLFMPYLPFLRFKNYKVSPFIPLLDPSSSASVSASPLSSFLSYSQKDLLKDVIAGVVVSVVAVPQGLAYSILANLPAVSQAVVALVMIVLVLVG